MSHPASTSMLAGRGIFVTQRALLSVVLSGGPRMWPSRRGQSPPSVGRTWRRRLSYCAPRSVGGSILPPGDYRRPCSTSLGGSRTSVALRRLKEPAAFSLGLGAHRAPEPLSRARGTPGTRHDPRSLNGRRHVRRDARPASRALFGSTPPG